MTLVFVACAKDAGRAGASNALLVVGYDREPDTMNRYATHILEDIQSCVVEGLVTSDEHMNIVPVLAAEIPTVDNGGVVLFMPPREEIPVVVEMDDIASVDFSTYPYQMNSLYG